ncbi:DUF6394 family protein [Suttonella sp. R2A3]|uniref:DUF6394 family protein n=1 Tax=Suttonella sp. R2A3 TaxID=2908648 RepID=UPI001F1A7DF5|nr:DUF6394 family protein [Suttonella sp. R2A3]UJF24699.1 DUF6394 family protein [Suttonella sp. R2A3]
MRSERVWFSFFILLALTLNVGFVYGSIDNPEHHDKIELYLAFVVSIVCTILKFGDRSHLGALLLATSLVADVQLLIAIGVWTFSVGMLDASTLSTIVSFTMGALVANLVSVVLVVIEVATLRR